MNFWNNFAAKHPAAAKWVREGGLFVIVSNLITVFKYLLLQFLPKAFASLPVVDFGWPGIDITLFGETFKWNILGYDAAHGGLPYFCAYMIAMVIGECINFPIQRNFVFRSRSTSSLYPVFMMLPSRTEIGGSSLMEDFKSAHRSSRQSKCSRIPVASSPFKSSSSVLIGGSISKELQKAIISRGLAVWYVILVIRRSRSYIGPKYSRNSSRVIS